MLPEEPPLHLHPDTSDRSLRTQYSMPKGVPTEDLILKLIEDQLRRAILIRMDLVEDHLLLLRPLLRREGAPTYDIEETLQSPMSEATR